MSDPLQDVLHQLRDLKTRLDNRKRDIEKLKEEMVELRSRIDTLPSAPKKETV
jgi:peptidoglycan hydrolase CwlO-like protein